MARDWAVGFIGTGTDKEFVRPLLNDWFNKADADGVDIFGIFPDQVPRTNKTLMECWSLFYEWDIKTTRVGEDAVIDALRLHDDKDQYLVVLGQDENQDRIFTALDAGIKVKDLLASLYDVEIDNPEPDLGGPVENTELERTYGKPREPLVLPREDFEVVKDVLEAVEAKVEGPATINRNCWVPPGLQEPTPMMQFAMDTATVELIHTYGLLGAAIRQIVREEIAMAWGQGHNTKEELVVEPTDYQAPEFVKVFTNEDGEYQLAKDRKRAPAGWKAAALTVAEAKEAGLDV